MTMIYWEAGNNLDNALVISLQQLPLLAKTLVYRHVNRLKNKEKENLEIIRCPI